MADEEEFHMDEDSDIEDEEEEEGSDDDTAFFPIEPVVHPALSSTNNTVATTASSQTLSKQTDEQAANKYSTGINASNNYPQDNNFEYVGKCNHFGKLKFIIGFSLITR